MSKSNSNIEKPPCVFFDRDGIVNQCPGPGYVETVDAFFLQVPAAKAIKLVRQKGYEAILITNQRGVGRGIMTLDMLGDIHAHMADLLDAEGSSLTDVFFCTDTDNSSPRRKTQSRHDSGGR